MAYPCTHDVASQSTNSIRCPRGPEHFLTNQGLYLTYNCAPQYILGYFTEMSHKSHWILQRILRLTLCNRRAFALSMRCPGSRPRPRVFRETLTVILLWRHSSGPWDNGESIAAHSNGIPIRKQGHMDAISGKRGHIDNMYGIQRIWICRPHRLC